MTTMELSPEEAHARRAEFDVIDVRAEHEFRGPLGHIEGAELLPLPELEARSNELPRGRLLLLVCRSGGRSAAACEFLERLAEQPVVNLAGGMIAWNRAGLPVVRSTPGSPLELFESVVAWMAQVGARERDAVRQELTASVRPPDRVADAPTRADVARAIDLVEQTLLRQSAPPDLELSVAAFRRSLAAL
jgi:rhodanese-related sulfurtransferase